VKAVLIKAYGEPDQYVIEDLPPKHPGPGQVVIDVKACGVNFLDSLMIAGKYQTKPPLPMTPGAEVAGVVKEVGAGVAGLPPGTRVLATPGYGGYAEEVAVDASRVFALPQAMDFTTAAAFPIAYATSHHALKDRAQLRAGETLLVLGAAGGVGLTAVEIGKILGARVIACASSETKLALCREYGADALINYSSSDLRERVRELTQGAGVDVIYDPVGGEHAEPALRSLGFGGRYLVIGFASGTIPKIPLNLVLLKITAIVGVFWGAYAQARPRENAANLAELLAWYAAGRLRPHVSNTFPLAGYREALGAVTGRAVQGKVVLLMG
jgi:NADPH2:quinone reductase